MRMRQSLAQFEAAFREETVDERQRRSGSAARRQSVPACAESQRIRSAATYASSCSWSPILVTTVVVTIVMFQTLSLLVGG